MMSTGRTFSGRERNAAFWNLQDGTFASAGSVLGLDAIGDGRALAVTDWDRDGDLDLWWSNRTGPQLQLARNAGLPDTHFVAFLLEGDGEGTSRDAIGARVEIRSARAAGEKRVATLRAGEGFLAQSSKWVHFGLGGSGGPIEVAVRWPAGETESFAGVTADGRFLLRQGAGIAEPLAPEPVAKAPGPKSSPVAAGAHRRIPMGLLLPLGRVPAADFEGARLEIPHRRGRPLLLNLWASWCPPCLAELRELAGGEAEIRAAGLDVLALALNGLGEDDSDPAESRAFLEEIDFPFESGRATGPLMAKLQSIHDLQMIFDRPLPVPTSLLLDAEGRVAVLYLGAVPLETLLADVRRLPDAKEARWPRAAALPGRVLEVAPLRRAAERNELALRLHYAKILERHGAWPEAVPHYRDAVGFAPEDARLRALLGMCLGRSGRFVEAEKELARAVELDPENAAYRNDLGSVLASQGRLEEAAACFAEALVRDPSLPGARENLARARPPGVAAGAD